MAGQRHDRSPIKEPTAVSRIHIVRLTLAFALTLVLSLGWNYTLIHAMLTGGVHGGMLLASVIGVTVVMLLTCRLHRTPSIQPHAWRIAGGAIVIFGLTSGLVAALRMDVPPPAAVALVYFGLASLWVTWLAWFPFLPLRLRGRLILLALLAMIQVSFVATFRVAGLTGDANVELAWRRGTSSDHRRPLAADASMSPRSSGNEADDPVDMTTAGPDDFPQYLGPGRDGIVPTPPALATDWDSRPPRLRWRRPVGAGWGGFAIVGRFGVTQEQRDQTECVVCYDLADGRERWIHAIPVRFDSSLGGPGPRATPTIHQGRVFTVGATGILHCLSATDGTPVWSVQTLADPLDNIAHGMCGSPLIVADLVVVSPCGRDGKSLAAYRCEDGTAVWQQGTHRASYSSPTLATFDDTPQILLFHSKGLAGHDAHSGELLWEYPWTNDVNTNCAQPLVHVGGPDRVLVSNGYSGGSALLQVTRLGREQWVSQPIWESRDLKAKFATPIQFRDFVYGLDNGILACLDPATGRRLWKQGRYGHGQLLLVDDLLLVQTEKGPVALVKPSPDRLEQLGVFPALDSKTWNTMALSGHLLLVRNDREAACYELPLQP